MTGILTQGLHRLHRHPGLSLPSAPSVLCTLDRPIIPSAPVGRTLQLLLCLFRYFTPSCWKLLYECCWYTPKSLHGLPVEDNCQFQWWTLHQFCITSDEWIYNDHATGMGSCIIELLQLVPSYFLGNIKQQHIHSEVNVCHSHSTSGLCMNVIAEYCV